MEPATDLSTFYGRYLQRCNDHRCDELGEFVADDVDGPGQGLGTYIAKVREVIEAFPDYRWNLQRLLTDGEWLAARLIGTGTHAGSFRGIAATGRAVSTQELVMYHVRDGKIIACWGDLHTTVRDQLVSGDIDA
jgi:predicted ester cyclase